MSSTTNPITFRLATIADETTITRLAARLATFELPPWRQPEDIAVADASEMMRAVRGGGRGNEVLIAERNGQPVGCLHVLETTDFFGRSHAHISVLATTSEAEGSGVGRALLEYAEAWAVRRGHGLITLNVFAANARARHLYDGAGWAPEILKYAKPL
ncbi:MAG TPA: GNAT family N-acetyltransferase [Vicinamibacterales bacterium]